MTKNRYFRFQILRKISGQKSTFLVKNSNVDPWINSYQKGIHQSSCHQIFGRNASFLGLVRGLETTKHNCTKSFHLFDRDNRENSIFFLLLNL